MKNYKQYENRVRYLSTRNLKDANYTFPENRKKYHIDHIFPIVKAYEYGIPEELVASLDNLQVMTSDMNHKKGARITTIPAPIIEWMSLNDVYL